MYFHFVCLTTDFSRNFTEILKPIRNGFYFNKGSIGHGLTLMNTDKKRKFVSPAARKNLMGYRRQAA